MAAKHIRNKPLLRSPTWQLFCALALFLLSVLLSRGNRMPALEEHLFYGVYSLPAFLRISFLAITQFGSVYVLLALAIAYLYRRQYHILLRLLMTGLSAYIVTGFCKDFWGRPRPYQMLDNVMKLDIAARGPGFPSGHIALATALAMTMYHYYPAKFRYIAGLWIIGVGLSRVYLGVHAPLDIVGGFAIGWACYALFRHVRMTDISFIGSKK